MEAPLLLNLALGDPTSIEDSIRVLRLAGRTSVRAATIVQNAIRDWLRAIASAVTIQTVVRSYQLRRKEERKAKVQERSAKNSAASKIQAFYRFYSAQLNITQLCETLTGAFGISNNIPNVDLFKHDGLLTQTDADKMREKGNTETALKGKDGITKVIKELWEFARQRGMVCKTEVEARDSMWRERGISINTRIILSLISNPEVDIDTKVLSHFILEDMLWSAVEMQNLDDDLLPPDVLRSIESMCVNNLPSKNWGIFRGAVRILAELCHLQKPSQNSVSSDMLVKLLNFLRLIFTLSEHPVFDLFSSSLPSQDCRAAWGTHVGFDIIRMFQGYFSHLSWDQLLECQYLKTIVLVWADGTEARYRPRHVAHCAWDEWPTDDIAFHKFLRDSVRAIIDSANKVERNLLELIAMYLLNGIRFTSLPIGLKDYFVYDDADKRSKLSCNCIARLLVEIFVAAHGCGMYFSHLIDTFQNEFSIECFSENNAGREGVFFGHHALFPVINPLTLSSSLKGCVTDNQQLTALYVLRGLSYGDLLKRVKMDEYLSAIRRFPDTLLGAWFHRRINPIGFQLENLLAHCAASIDSVDCLGMYGGDLNLLIESKKKNTLLHTAAFYGSEKVLRLLIERGMQPTVQNRDGDSPLSIARRRKHKDCVTVLQGVTSNDDGAIENLVSAIETPGRPLVPVATVTKRQTKRRKAKKKRKKKKKIQEAEPANDASEGDDDIDDGDSGAVVDVEKHSDAVGKISGEVSSIKLSIDIAKEIFAAQQEITKHDNIIRILSCQINGEEGRLMLEPVDGRLEALISLVFSGRPNSHIYSFNMRLGWCQQLLSAIGKVHLYRVHGNIDTMNIFYTTSLDGSITVKLGPVADRKCSSRTSHSRNIFYAPSPSPSLASDTRADVAAAGCVLSLLLCGHHIYGLESADQIRNMERRTLFNEPVLRGVSVEACDLIGRMAEGSVGIDTCLRHPVFWKAGRRLAYVSELVRTGGHLRLPSDEKLGLGADWRGRLRPEGVLSRHVRSSPSSYGCHPGELLRLCRNFYQHPPKDYRGGDPFDDAVLDLRRFPSLFLDLFAVFGVEEVM